MLEVLPIEPEFGGNPGDAEDSEDEDASEDQGAEGVKVKGWGWAMMTMRIAMMNLDLKTATTAMATLTLTAQFMLMARAPQFVGTLTSNIGRFVWEQSAAWRGTSSPPVFDLDGSPWFAGWEGSPFPHKPLWMSKSANA